MLKSIVNGAEHDIVKIPMKGKNLFDKNSDTINNNGYTRPGVEVPAGTYSINNGTPHHVYYRIGYSGVAQQTNPRMKTERIVASDSLYVWRDAGIREDGVMLNIGSKALPYEPYGYQDELQTTTGTLLFKGYDLPIKVKSLLGSGVQNGTPSPDNVVVPEFCGVRTKNICPSATAETKTNNGITAVSNGSGTYHVSGTATADADIRFNVQSFWIPQSIGNYHDGTFSMFNSAIYDNTAVKLAFYYQGTKLDDWGLTSLNRTSTTYSNMSEKDCDAIGFTVKSGVTVDFTISPEFTNDGVLPTEFEPYGYKITFNNNGENLWDEDYTGISGSLKYVPVYVGNGSFTLSTSCPAIERAASLFFLVGNVQTGASTVSNGVYKNRPITVASSDGYVTVAYRYVSYQSGAADPRNEQTMLNLGSTPLPYSPYLNKTTPIYLGEVPTIRRIKKLVLTGEEEYVYDASYTRFYFAISDMIGIGVRLTPLYCTHYQNISDGRPVGDVPNNSIYTGGGNDADKVFIKTTDYTSASDFKSYLTQQYQNGTPVTIWYILADPQTGIVNEPLARIGNYADELTEISVHNLSSPLYGIRDYKDILNLSTGVVTRKIKKLVFNGSLSI